MVEWARAVLEDKAQTSNGTAARTQERAYD